MKLLIYTDVSKPRISYTTDFVFRCVLGLDIVLIQDKQLFSDSAGRKLNYSGHCFSCECLHIVPSLFLHREDIIAVGDILPSFTGGIAPPGAVGNRDADPLSIIFFMISRYEEYTVSETDSHGRFPASASVAWQDGFLEFPIVDAWVDWMRRRLNGLFPESVPIAVPPYHFVPSYDIDHVRAYLWKGIFRTAGGIIRDLPGLGKGLFWERIRVLAGLADDPYDVFGYLDSLHRAHGLSPVYFWLLGDFGAFDKNPHYRHIRFREEIRKVSSGNRIGIHPSYRSFLDYGRMREEVKRLEDICLLPEISRNRFHFLRFRMPDSYRLLLDLGIREDYSMAFPEAIGFRAGTSHPFYWYDLERECSTALKIHPFQVMDVSLKNYLNLSGEASMERMALMVGHVRRYGGHFVSLWHNSSFGGKEWEGWKEVYERFVVLAQEGSIPNS